MTTECNQEPFPFHPLNQREIRGQFDGGSITSDAGGLLLREVEKRTNIIGQFASCFSDYRDPELVEHGGGGVVATDLRIGIRLRGFKRSRGLAARSVVGGVGGEGGSDRGTAATGARSGHRPGGEEHAEPHGTGSGEVGGKGAVQEDHPGRSGGGSDAGGYFFASA